MGFFSWKTQDTGKSIANQYSGKPTFTVFMLDDKGNSWVEDNYEGYGEVVYYKVEKISTGDTLEGASTPYWNGECHLPVDIDMYIKKGVINGRPLDIYKRFDLDRDFETLKDIIIWLNSEYTSNILKVCRPVFERMEYENKLLDK